jgi:hypothetical protein
MTKNLLLQISFLFIFSLISCNKSADVSPETKQEILKTEKSALTGSAVTKVIGNAGSNITLANTNVIVPTGAMQAGASLTIQATSNPLESGSQALQISGDWQKPIWLEFSYPADELHPENYMIAFQTAKGDWITSPKVKVDKVKRTFAIRLGQTLGGKVAMRQGGNEAANKAESQKPTANSRQSTAGTYSFAASHEFYLKPEKSVIDLGESVSFNAYARAGDTDGYWRKSKNGNYYYDDGELVPLTKPKTQPTGTNNDPDDDDYLVPLVPVDKTVVLSDDDEIVPLAKAIKEAPFTNIKSGYTRSWILMDGPGNLAPTGNTGAKYTAPKDESAKGKIAKVSFFSKNDKTRQDLEASATIRIKDGLTRYTGTISSIYVRTYGTNLIYTETIKSKSTATFLNSLGTPKRFETKYYIGTQPSQNLTTTVDEYSVLVSDGKSYRKLSGSCSASGNDAGFLVMYVNPDNTMELSGWLDVETNKCVVDTYCENCIPKNGTDNTSFYTQLDNPVKIKMNYNDPKIMAGTFTQKEKIGDQNITIKITWDFKRED